MKKILKEYFRCFLPLWENKNNAFNIFLGIIFLPVIIPLFIVIAPIWFPCRKISDYLNK